eukprot:gb/GECG01014664.1/.p1 GENE.gb/GECG01014664.1/~~gb/GECG01014664.1/.p1  ORF type:complete len:1181 (+),score=164.21 gb/GECG01014664.1/:1-3543(+)
MENDTSMNGKGVEEEHGPDTSTDNSIPASAKTTGYEETHSRVSKAPASQDSEASMEDAYPKVIVTSGSVDSANQPSSPGTDSLQQAGSFSLCVGGVLGGVTYNDLLDKFPGMEFPRSANQSAAVATQLTNHPPMEKGASLPGTVEKYPYKPPRIDGVRYQVQPPPLLDNTPYTQEFGYVKPGSESSASHRPKDEMLSEAIQEEKKRVRPPNLNVPLSRSKTKVGKGKKIRTLFQPEWPTDAAEIPDINKYPSASASLSEEERWDPSRCSTKAKWNEVEDWIRFARQVLHLRGNGADSDGNDYHRQKQHEFFNQAKDAYGISFEFGTEPPDKWDEKILAFLHDCDYDVPRAKLQLVSQVGGGFEFATLSCTDTLCGERLHGRMDNSSSASTPGTVPMSSGTASMTQPAASQNRGQSVTRSTQEDTLEVSGQSGLEKLKGLVGLRPLADTDPVTELYETGKRRLHKVNEFIDTEMSESTLVQEWTDWANELQKLLKSKNALKWDVLVEMRERALGLRPLNRFSSGGANAQLARRANEYADELAKRLAAATRWRAKVRDALSRIHEKFDYSAFESLALQSNQLWVKLPEQPIVTRIYKACQRAKREAEQMIFEAAKAAAFARQRHAVYTERFAAFRVASSHSKRSRMSMGSGQTHDENLSSADFSGDSYASSSISQAPKMECVDSRDQDVRTEQCMLSNCLTWEDFVKVAAANFSASSIASSIYGPPPYLEEDGDVSEPPRLPPAPKPVSIASMRSMLSKLERLPVKFTETDIIARRLKHVEDLAQRISALFPKHVYHSSGPSGKRVSQAHMLSSVPRWASNCRFPVAREVFPDRSKEDENKVLPQSSSAATDTSDEQDPGKWMEESLGTGASSRGTNLGGGCAYVSYHSPESGGAVATAGGTSFAAQLGKQGGATGSSVHVAASSDGNSFTTENPSATTEKDSTKTGAEKSTSKEDGDNLPNIVSSRQLGFKEDYRLGRIPIEHLLALATDVEDCGVGFREGVLITHYASISREWRRRCSTLFSSPFSPQLSEIQSMIEDAEASPVDFSEDVASLRDEVLKAAKWLLCVRSVISLLHAAGNGATTHEQARDMKNPGNTTNKATLANSIEGAQRKAGSDKSKLKADSLSLAKEAITCMKDGGCPRMPKELVPLEKLVGTAEGAGVYSSCKHKRECRRSLLATP